MFLSFFLEHEKRKKGPTGVIHHQNKIKKSERNSRKGRQTKKKQLWFQLTERKVARHKSLCQMIKSPERKRKKRRRKA